MNRVQRILLQEGIFDFWKPFKVGDRVHVKPLNRNDYITKVRKGDSGYEYEIEARPGKWYSSDQIEEWV